MQEWPWADYVNEELSQHFLNYVETLRDISTEVYYDSDDGASKVQLALSGKLLSGKPVVQVRVTASEHKFGSGRYVTIDARPLTQELCARRGGRELSPDPRGGWSFVADIPGLSAARIRSAKILRGLKALVQWVLLLGYLALGVVVTGIWSGLARRLHAPCDQHEMCSPGFCDRGRCMSLGSAAEKTFGAPCKVVAECGEFVCVDGRCSSCERDDECPPKEPQEVYCDHSSTRRACSMNPDRTGP